MNDGAETAPTYTTAQLLGRIDERTRNTADTVTSLGGKVDALGIRVVSVENALENLKLVKTIVFGGVGLILIALLSTVIAMVITKPEIRQSPQEQVR